MFAFVQETTKATYPSRTTTGADETTTILRQAIQVGIDSGSSIPANDFVRELTERYSTNPTDTACTRT